MSESAGPVVAQGPLAASRFWGLPKTAVGWWAAGLWMVSLAGALAPLLARLVGSQGLFNVTFALGSGPFGMLLSPVALVLFLVAVLVKRERSVLVWLSLGIPLSLAFFAIGEVLWME